MLEHTPLKDLGARFERFARIECRGSSPLYEQLALGVAADPALLEIAAQTRPGQPVPNLLFAAVHYLLLNKPESPLAAYYPSLNSGAIPTDDPYPYFQAFCLEHRPQILELLATRLVQTNEIRRCACLLPVFGLVAQAAPGKPLAVVEIGTSAGLNLLWDAYGYDYGTGRKYGNLTSSLQLSTTLRGDLRPPLPEGLPPVTFRLGLDLNPIDITDPAATSWLQALIWPEHRHRAAWLKEALAIAQANPPKLLAGNALDLLPQIWETIPEEASLCVLHTFTVNQFTPEMREQLVNLLAQQSQKRDVYEVSIEWFQGRRNPTLGLAVYRAGQKVEKDLGQCEGHAGWLEWQDEATSDKG